MSGTSTVASRLRAAADGANRWPVLVVLCLSLLLAALDATVLHVAVSAVTEDLRPSAVGLLWIVAYYLTMGLAPIPQAGGWNIVIGFGIACVGFLITTRWR